MTEFMMDWAREQRTGLAEALMCEGKTPGQIEAILAAAGDRKLLLTRLSAEKLTALPGSRQSDLDYDPLSRTAYWGTVAAATFPGACVVCAGTSDLPIAREAARTLEFFGYRGPLIADVGVAGLWRLMERLEEIRRFPLVIAVAGMEGALFSVLAGLTASVVIAVPSSVGYGVAAGGQAALHSALASCAPGVLTVNIDNGYGAACAVIKILRR
jgi:NCAIR mutase (PurE)-related protein